ncbi:hypothetical protein E2C01_050073 [Portunus trituberculatus]|uniref:Uncharacterized protein n=1 Tax=Portunus trituberculatus TaxID=210409 RepID=A0A5B7GF37_PORTR|nr:hypothetical protein [Portunus trituberculatus]
MGYFGGFQFFMQQNSELQIKHTICLKNFNISKRCYFAGFQRFMHQNSECRHNTLFV